MQKIQLSLQSNGTRFECFSTDSNVWNDSERKETPEKTLLLAMLDRAIRDAINSFERFNQREAMKWINNRRYLIKKEPFSFEWVCDQLDIDPRTVRKQIIDFQSGKEYLPAAQNIGRKRV